MWDPVFILPLVQEAGRRALEAQGRTLREVKPDKSLVTEADRAIEAFLYQALEVETSGWGFLGEETAESLDPEALNRVWSGPCWVVDPIDGTSPFYWSLPTWGVSLGIMDQGKLLEGAVYLPGLGEMFFTQGGRSFWMKAPADQALDWQGVQELPRARRTLEPEALVALSQRFLNLGPWTLEQNVHMSGCAVFSLAKMAQGCFAAYVSALKLWDFAGAWPLVRNLGYGARVRGHNLDQADLRKDILGRGTGGWYSGDQILFAGLEVLDTLEAQLLPKEARP